MGKKTKKSRFNQVVDIDITYSSSSVANGTAETALAKLNLSKEKLSELQRIKAQLPSAPQSIRIEEEIARIPEEGPFRVVLVNVAFTATRDQIEEFFLPLKPTNIKIVEDEGRFRGFCFVDFANRTDLAAALDKNGSFFLSRKVTMRLADNPSDREGGNRRAFGGNSGFPASEGWASRKPRPTEDFRRGPDSNLDAPSDGSAWRRGIARPSLQREVPLANQSSPAWSKAPPNFGGGTAPLAAPTSQQELPQRPMIKLAPRTKPKESDEFVPTSRYASIFGDAKPIDTAARDRELSEKLAVTELGTTSSNLGKTAPTTVDTSAAPSQAAHEVPVKSRQNAWKKPLITNE